MNVTVDLDDLLFVLVSSEDADEADHTALKAARKSLLDAVFAAIDLEEGRYDVYADH